MQGKNEIRINTATLVGILDEWWKRNTVALGVRQAVTHVKWMQTDNAFVIMLTERGEQDSKSD